MRDRVIDIDLKGCLFCAQAAGKRMLEQGKGGNIINISSGAGMRTVVNRAGYGSAKAGLIMLTRQLAMELSPHGIRVNAIAPGIIRTEMTRDRWAHSETAGQLLATIPMGRWGEPADIANAALFSTSLFLRNCK